MSQPSPAFDRDSLIQAHLRFAQWLASLWGYRLDWDDRRQIAALALITTIDDVLARRLDLLENLTNHSSKSLRGYIRSAVRNALLRTDAHVGGAVATDASLRHKLLKAETRLIKTLNRWPTTEELSDATGATVERIQHHRSAARTAASLTAPLVDAHGQVQNETLADTIASDTFGPPDADVEQRDNRLMVKALIDGARPALTPDELTVIRLRFGLGQRTPGHVTDCDCLSCRGGMDRTHAEVAAEMNISIVKARKLSERALKKIKAGAEPIDSTPHLTVAQVKNIEQSAIWKLRCGIKERRDVV